MLEVICAGVKASEQASILGRLRFCFGGGGERGRDLPSDTNADTNSGCETIVWLGRMVVDEGDDEMVKLRDG